MRWLFFLLLFVVSGCIRTAPPVWVEIPTVSQLLSRLATGANRYTSLDGAAAVSLTQADKYMSSQQFLLLQKPDRLRTDVLTGFGQLILQLTSDGEELSVFLNTTVPGRFLRGPASKENISRFIRVPLAVDDFLSLLLYSPPIIAHYDSSIAIVDGLLQLTLHAGSREQQLFFNQQLQVVGSQYFSTGKKYLTVDYNKFSATSGFPHTIVIELPPEETMIKVKFTELVLNEKIETEKFHLSKPNNIKLEILL